MPMIGRRIYPGMKRAAWGLMQSGDFPVPALYLKFGENTGNALKDSSPEGNDGVNHGATWMKGYLGPGLGFDGLDNYAKVEDNASLDLTTAMTIVAWVFPEDDTLYDTVLAKYKIAGAANYWVRYETNSKIGVLYHNPGYKGVVSLSSLLTNIYSHIAFTWDGIYWRIYINGVLDTTSLDLSASPPIANDAPLYIGSSTGAAQFWDGIIDEVRIYNEALTARQIREIYLGIR